MSLLSSHDQYIVYELCPLAYVSALTLTMSQPCLHLGNPIGVTGIDLHMEDIAQEITYYNQVDGSYAFMVNENGKFPQMITAAPSQV